MELAAIEIGSRNYRKILDKMLGRKHDEARLLIYQSYRLFPLGYLSLCDSEKVHATSQARLSIRLSYISEI